MKKTKIWVTCSILFLSINLHAQLDNSETTNLLLEEDLNQDFNSDAKKEAYFQRIDCTIGLFASPLLGKTANFLKMGTGASTDYTITNKNNFYFGLGTKYFRNYLKRLYPFVELRRQANRNRTTLNELILGKQFGAFRLQSEFGFIAHSYLARSSDIPRKERRLKGFSPGAKFIYSLEIGKNIENNKFNSDWLMATYIDFNLGIRHLFFSLKEINGYMLELGISARMGLKRKDKLKSSGME